MTDGLNRCTFIGNIGQDPELRVTPGGTAVLKFSLGCNESYVDRNNVRQERVEWIRCTVFGKRAEGLAKFLTKGTKLYVEGAFHTSSYEKNGEKRYSTEIHVRDVVLCGGGARREGDANGGNGERRERHAQADEEPRGFTYGPDANKGNDIPPDDDIPF